MGNTMISASSVLLADGMGIFYALLGAALAAFLAGAGSAIGVGMWGRGSSRRADGEAGAFCQGADPAPDAAQGLLFLAACLPIGVAGLISAIHQGKTSVASISLLAKRPESFGRAMLLPAMVETYAILALLVSLLTVTTL